MAKYRKRPVVIDAEPYRAGLEDGFGEDQRPFIQTLEGKMAISPTDWIVTGVQGERYPVKDGIFQATYEAVGEAGTQTPS